jgi:uncharacterized protein YyaL (SSP411 family)
LYAEAAAKTNDPLLLQATEGIAVWLTEQMRDSNGGFYASMDADADGMEGGFHVWGKQELIDILSEEEYQAVTRQYGLDLPANFEGEFWHLVDSTKTDESEPAGLESARQKMLARRAQRIPPATDQKQLTSWNALCIEGFSRAALALDRADWAEVAEQTLAFVKKSLWKNNRLFAVHAAGKTSLPAYLDDHAFLLKGVLSLLQTRWDKAHLNFAIDLADTMIENFEDPESGGFFFSAADQDAPITRLRPLQDDATPSGNGIAVIALETLGHLLAEPRYLETAGKALMSSHGEQRKHPLAFATLLVALSRHLKPLTQVIITGTDHEDAKAFKAVTRGFDRVNCYVFGSGSGELTNITGLYETGEQTRAYIGESLSCQPPLESSHALQEQLEHA